jgi:hypothetical protein
LTPEDYALSLVESSDGASVSGNLNRNRLKSNNYNPVLGGKKVEEMFSDSTNIHGSMPIKPKEYYNTEKFGSHLLMNSDSHTALAAAKLHEEGGA